MLAKTSECFHSLAFLTRNQPLTVISAQSFYLETSVFFETLNKELIQKPGQSNDLPPKQR